VPEVRDSQERLEFSERVDMYKRIYKYPVKPGKFEIELPRGARVLSVATQKNDAVMWVLLDPNERVMEKRRFATIGTGHDADVVSGWNFVGTFQLDDGALVFHLFDALGGGVQ